MSRRIRALLSLLALGFALTAIACADATAPSTEVCDQERPWTCLNR